MSWLESAAELLLAVVVAGLVVGFWCWVGSMVGPEPPPGPECSELPPDPE